jgi:hypothetical protein
MRNIADRKKAIKAKERKKAREFKKLKEERKLKNKFLNIGFEPRYRFNLNNFANVLGVTVAEMNKMVKDGVWDTYFDQQLEKIFQNE